MRIIFRYPILSDEPKCSSTNFFGTKRFKKIPLKIVICPLSSVIFFDTRFFLENRRVPLQRFSFRSCETKNFDKTVMNPPLLFMKLFDKGIFLNHQTVFQWNNLVQSDKNFSWKLVIPPPFLPMKYFRLPKKFCSTELFPGEAFRSCEIKKTWQNPEKFPLPGLKIFDTRKLWKHRRVPLRFYRYSETNFSNGVQWYPLLMHKLLRYTKLSETAKSSPTNFFGPVWHKVFDGKRWYPPVWCINLLVPETFWYTEVFTNEIFRYCVTQSFRQYREASPSFAWKFSITEFFRNTEGFSYEIYRHCEAETFQRSPVLSPSYAYHFSLPDIFWWTEVFFNDLFGTVRYKKFNWKLWYAPSYPSFFSIPDFFWKTEGFLCKDFRFGPVRQKISTKPWWTPLLIKHFFGKGFFSETPNCSPMK